MSILTHITGWRSRIINAMIDALQRQRIIAGDGLVCAETPNGTHLSLARTPATKPPYPFGADEWLWGVDILSHDTIRVGKGMVLLQSWQSGLSGIVCHGDTFTVTSEVQFVRWAAHSNMLDVSLELGASQKYIPYSGGDYLAGGPIHRIESFAIDGAWHIRRIVPYHFGALITPCMPHGNEDGATLMWINTVPSWQAFDP